MPTQKTPVSLGTVIVVLYSHVVHEATLTTALQLLPLTTVPLPEEFSAPPRSRRTSVNSVKH